MMKKMAFLTGAGLGYVLGTRAGRQRYEQLKSGAQGMWHNPKVQETVEHAHDLAAQKAGEVQDKIGSTIGSASGADDSTSSENSPGPPAGFVENPADSR